MQGLMMDYPLTVDQILEHANRLYPRKRVTTKLPDGSLHRYTYADLRGRAMRAANVLRRLGVQPGDRVGTFAWNNFQHLELYYAIPGAGAVCHTLNIRLFPEQLAYVINHAEDKVIFVDGTLLPLLEKVAGEIQSVEQFVIFNADKGAEPKLPNPSFYEDLMAEADEEFEWAVTDEDLAMGLCYTSGTTGDPKGVLYSHRSTYLHALGMNQANAVGLTERDVLLAVVPQFHVMCWGLPFAAPFAGTELVLPGPHLVPSVLADLIVEEKVTVAAGVPTIWSALFQELKSKPRDLSQLRTLVVGGAAMPRSLIQAFEDELGVHVLHAWGMTETSPLGTVSALQSSHGSLSEDEKLDLRAKQGYAVSGIELRICSESGDELPWDGATVGEVQVRGPWVAKSYFRLTPTSEQFTDDGWFRTGDVATIDGDGFMQITDRTKDLVKSGGEWISSVALESALVAHSEIAEAAVIAIPDERWGERPMGVVVLATGVQVLSAEEIRAFLAPHFAKFWIPEKFVFVDQVPKTSVGKYDKKVLRKRHAEGLLE